MANVTIAGDIYTVADPEYDGKYLGAELQKTEYGILIEFKTMFELNRAIKTGTCAFTVFGEKA